MQGTNRTARGDGMVASTPESGAPDWTHGGQVDQFSPIREGRSWLSPPRKLKTPEPDAEQILSSPLGAGILRTVSQLDRPNPVQTESFDAIAKSNGWKDETAALQLFVHLEGEALNVALLMLEEERATREGLSQGGWQFLEGSLKV